ncbi:unnamed protein product [marine sediment metagenome]|uniref:Major facilitator superfamily (MFS) profile domain-containing protein n=1 Tax=marine sediment metagenome TaxID=412755 RepID=X1BWD2_9ZZZZ
MGFLALLPFIRDEFTLTRTQVGLYTTCFFVGATMIAILTGNLVDKLGTKKSMFLGIVCFEFAMLLHTLSFSYGVIMFLAFIAGMCMSILTPSINKGVMLSIPPEKRAVSMGMVQCGGGLGGIAGGKYTPDIREKLWVADGDTILCGFCDNNWFFML